MGISVINRRTREVRTSVVGRGWVMLKDEYYRRLARTNRRIADARERVDQQKVRVLELNGRPECGDAVVTRRRLDRSLRLMTQQRAVLVRQLVHWPT